MFLILGIVVAGLSGYALGVTDAEIQQILALHNACRAGTGANLAPMTWDTNLASFAAEHAVGENCQEEHTTNAMRQQVPGYVGQDVGENIAGGMDSEWTSADTIAMVTEGVNEWCAEKANYDYASNTCTADCGHYTQIVWDISVKVGCSLTLCQSNTTYQMVCNYFAAGNMEGEKPYGRGDTGGTTVEPALPGTDAPDVLEVESPGTETEAETPPNCTPSTTTETQGTDTVITTVTCEKNSQKTTVTTVSENGDESTSTSTIEFS